MYGLGLDEIKAGDAGTSILSVLLSLASQKWDIYHMRTAPAKLLFCYPALALCSSTQNIPHPASSSPPPFPNHTLSTLSPGSLGSFAEAHRPTLCWRSEGVPAGSLLHYRDYHKKSYITWGPHGTYVVPLRLPLPFSSSVPSPLFPLPSFLSRD